MELTPGALLYLLLDEILFGAWGWDHYPVYT